MVNLKKFQHSVHSLLVLLLSTLSIGQHLLPLLLLLQVSIIGQFFPQHHDLPEKL